MYPSTHVFSLFLIIALALTCYSEQVDGVVHDATGAVIAGATIKLESGFFREITKSDDQGRFSFPNVPLKSGLISATANGFDDGHKDWNAERNGALYIEFVLQLASASEQVIVSATRTGVRLSDTPGSAVLLTSNDLASTPALRIDDVMRQVPGFSLFRRSGSRTANASNQGVSLRGLGGTAASRALVLADGIPLVDAFGGWVYWDRVPRISLSSVEVFRGGASNLYGSGALGGVVELITRQPEAPSFNFETSYGNERTPDLSLWTGARVGKWDLSLTTEMFRTDGFIQVPDSLRGVVDTPVNSKDASVYARIGHEFGMNGKIFARGSFYTEGRQNGTPIQKNDTSLAEGAAGLDKKFGNNDSLAARIYGDVQGYNQTFSAIANDRMSESLTDIQHVPEQVAGSTVQWMHILGQSQTLMGGVDLQEVMGASDEQLFLRGTHTSNRAAGGRQRAIGLFGQDILRPRQKWTVIIGARLDDWNNFDASSITTPVVPTVPAAATFFRSRSDTAFSPRLSLLGSVNNHLSITASIYRAFRAPNLNELYRNFRVGNVLTNGNAFLNAERLTGAETGAKLTAWDQKLNIRGTFFWSDIVNPVENVTISSTAALITRQKQNLGRTRSRGVELDGAFHVSNAIQFSAGYEYTAATVVSYPGNPGGISLVGRDVPQVPRNVFTWQALYSSPSKFFASVQGRFIGRQFDDDQNQFPLNRFYTTDLELGQTLHRNIELFAAVENILDQRYQVARTPIINLGSPILFRVGLRLNYPALKHH
ncbi:MAG: TonB-dependent receptor [Terriglobales bacterium]